MLKLAGPSVQGLSFWSWRFILLLFLRLLLGAILITVTSSSRPSNQQPHLCVIRPVTARSWISLQLLASFSHLELDESYTTTSTPTPTQRSGEITHRNGSTRIIDDKHHLDDDNDHHHGTDHRPSHLIRLMERAVKYITIQWVPIFSTFPPVRNHKNDMNSSFLRGTVRANMNAPLLMINRRLDIRSIVTEVLSSTATTRHGTTTTTCCSEPNPPFAFIGHNNSSRKSVVELPTTGDVIVLTTLAGTEAKNSTSRPSPLPLSLKPTRQTHPSEHHNRTSKRIQVVPTSSNALFRRLQFLLETVTDDEVVGSREIRIRRNGRAIHLPETIARLVDLTRVMGDVQQNGRLTSPSSQPKRGHQHLTSLTSFAADDIMLPTTTTTTVDLSGTWKLIITKEFQDQYDTFLQVCGESYWGRKLILNALGMHTLIIRQLKNSKNGNGGDDLELLDMTPIGSWNRTLVPSQSTQQRSCPSMPSFRRTTTTRINTANNNNNNNMITKQIINDDEDDDSSDGEVYLNELLDPQGDALTVTAYWCEGGTIHKSFLQSSKPKIRHAIIETNRYLMKVHEEEDDDESITTYDNSNNNNNDEGDVILVCESTYHPLPSATKTESTSQLSSTFASSSRHSNNIGNVRFGNTVSVVWKFRRVHTAP